MPRTGTIAMAKRLKEKERKKLTRDIAEGKYLRVLPSNIYVQGLTFPDLKVVINASGGGANTTAIQKPGRLLQKRPGKKYGVMVDFQYVCTDYEKDNRKSPPYMQIIGESKARLNAYREIGYDIVEARGINHAREVILGAYEDIVEEDVEQPPTEGVDPLAEAYERIENIMLSKTAEELMGHYMLRKKILYDRHNIKRKLPGWNQAVGLWGALMNQMGEVVDQNHWAPGVVMEAAFARARRDRHPDGPFGNSLKSEKYLMGALSMHLDIPLEAVREGASREALVEKIDRETRKNLREMRDAPSADTAANMAWFMPHVRFLHILSRYGPANGSLGQVLEPYPSRTSSPRFICSSIKMWSSLP